MNENAQANALSKLASACLSQINKTVYFEIKKAPSVVDGEMLQ